MRSVALSEAQAYTSILSTGSIEAPAFSSIVRSGSASFSIATLKAVRPEASSASTAAPLSRSSLVISTTACEEEVAGGRREGVGTA